MLKEILNERGITQERLGSAVGVTRSAISALCSGKEDCSIDLLAGICTELNVSPDQVLPLTGEHSLHTILERINTSHETRVGTVVGASATVRATRQTGNLELAGWCGIIASALFQMNGSYMGLEEVHGLVAQMLDPEEANAASAVIYDTLSDPLTQWLRQTTFKLRSPSVFLISPVRQNEPKYEKASKSYLKHLSAAGVRCHYPLLDTPQGCPNGASIVLRNIQGMMEATEVHAIWLQEKDVEGKFKESNGSACDLQTTIALGKPFFMVNHDEIEPTPHKSYTNVALLLDKVWRTATGRRWHSPQELAKAAAGE